MSCRDGTAIGPKARKRATQDQEASNGQTLTDGPPANGNKNGRATKMAQLGWFPAGIGNRSASIVRVVIRNNCDDQRRIAADERCLGKDTFCDTYD